MALAEGEEKSWPFLSPQNVFFSINFAKCSCFTAWVQCCCVSRSWLSLFLCSFCLCRSSFRFRRIIKHLWYNSPCCSRVLVNYCVRSQKIILSFEEASNYSQAAWPSCLPEVLSSRHYLEEWTFPECTFASVQNPEHYLKWLREVTLTLRYYGLNEVGCTHIPVFWHC